MKQQFHDEILTSSTMLDHYLDPNSRLKYALRWLDRHLHAFYATVYTTEFQKIAYDGINAMFGDIEVRANGSAGRIMVSIQRGDTFVSFIGEDGGNWQQCGLQGINGACIPVSEMLETVRMQWDTSKLQWNRSKYW